MSTVEKILLDFDPDRKNLLSVLKKINSIFGYVNEENAQEVAKYFSITESEVFEKATFYDEIKTKKTADVLIQVCSSANCAINGSFSIVSEIENFLKIKSKKNFNHNVELEEVSCLGHCGEGPIMIVNGNVYTQVTKSSIYGILEGYL